MTYQRANTRQEPRTANCDRVWYNIGRLRFVLPIGQCLHFEKICLIADRKDVFELFEFQVG